VHQKLAGFEARPLANVLYALGRMRTQVPAQWLDDVAQVRPGQGSGGGSCSGAHACALTASSTWQLAAGHAWAHGRPLE
jgi:hypothetical protein